MLRFVSSHIGISRVGKLFLILFSARFHGFDADLLFFRLFFFPLFPDKTKKNKMCYMYIDICLSYSVFRK